MRRHTWAFVAGSVLVSGAAPVSAQLTGTLGADLTLTSSCTISGGSGTSGLDFGTLDFGTHPATFSGVLTTQATGGAGVAGNTNIVCSPDVTSVTVIVDGGTHAGQGGGVGPGARALAAGLNYVPYEVYATAGFASPYPTNGTGVSVNIASPGQTFNLPIYGRINKTSPDAVSAGLYSDTLQVTLSW
jgi:spore coat protein U-like protein